MVSLAKSKGYKVAVVTVTKTEVGQGDIRLQVPDLGQVLESGLWGESAWGSSLWGNPSCYLEPILQIISNGSFPKAGIDNGRRDALESLLKTRIVTREEFLHEL